MMIWATIVVIILIILIIIVYQRFHIVTDPSIDYQDMLSKLKTGDVIMMKENSFLSTVYMSYYTHAGLVVVLNGRPYIFEAWLNGYNGAPVYKDNRNKDNRNKDTKDKREIFLFPLEERLVQFNGTSYYMELQQQPTSEGYEKLYKFVQGALDEFRYNANILRFVGLSKFDGGVVCSELVLLGLIELGVATRESIYFHNLLNLASLDNFTAPRFIRLSS